MLIHDPAKLKLGKKPAVHKPTDLKFANYLNRTIVPQAPAACDWTPAVAGNWPMMLNDELGDCTCAAAGHMIELWTANNGSMFVPPDSSILAAYETVGGYKPGHPDTDNGAVESDVVDYWRTNGIAGRFIDAAVVIDPKHNANVREGLFLFGGIYAGVLLPLTAQSQPEWDVAPGDDSNPDAEPGSWGGHAVPIVAYDTAGLTCVTWGALKRLTWAWWNKYADESRALLSKDWAQPANSAPGRFNYAQLEADLAAIKN